MKNDDFEDVNAQNDADFPAGNDFEPDAIDFNESDSFDEFDAPGEAKKGSIGELWRNNPLVKFAVIGLGVVVVIVAFSLFSGGGDAPKSSVGVPLQQSEAPGGQTTEAYRDAIQDVNEQRLERALREGTSSIPIPTAGPTTTTPDGEQAEPPVTLDDPLANWRAAAQVPAQRAEPPARPGIGNTASTGNVQTGAVTDPNVPQQPMGPDPAAVDSLATAMAQQMQAILGGHQIRSPQIMSVTSADFLTPPDTGDQTIVEAPVIQEILVPAGTIVYAQMLTEASTDARGPILARISSGPLNGYRMLGTFTNTERFLTLNFNQVVIDGVSYPAQGIAIDPKTTLPAVATEVNRRYFSRFILPAAASFIEGMGNAIAQREATTISIDGSVVTSSTRDLDTREELAAGFAEGTRVVARELDREGNRIQPLIRVHAGTPIGILFLAPVIKPEE